MRFPLLIIVILLAFSRQLAGAVTPEELKDREARLTAHLQAFATWVDDVCDLSEQQQIRLNDRIKQAITQSQTAYQFPDFPQQIKTVQHRLYDYSPIRFVGIRGAAWGVFQAGLNDNLLKILNEDQQRKYRAAMESRKQNLHQYFLAQVINTADRELFLTDKQKEAIRKLFPKQLPLLENGLYSITPNTGYLNDKSIDIILTRSPLAFNKTQMKWRQYLQVERQKTVFLIEAASVNEMHNKISTEAKKQKEKMESALELRIAYYSKKFQPSEEGLQYLEIAGKGTTVKLVNRWKENALIQLDKNAGRVVQNNLLTNRILVSHIRIYGFDHHPLWEHAVRKVITDSAFNKSQKASQNATTGYAVALLDQELWLTPEQRHHLEAICQILLLLDKFQCSNLSRLGAQYDLSLLASVLYDSNQDKFHELLNGSQRNVINQLKRQLLEAKVGDIFSFAIKTPLGATVLRRIDNKDQ